MFLRSDGVGDCAPPASFSPIEGLQGQRSVGSGFRPDIEGLRAVAVVAVVLFHAGLPGVAGGFVGVDVFFVISGFLITGLLWREVSSAGLWGASIRRFNVGDLRRYADPAVPSLAGKKKNLEVNL